MPQVLKEGRMDDVDRIRIGFMLPNFTLKDFSGKEIKLADFWGKKDLIVFFFDDYGCQDCGNFLADLQSNLNELSGLDAVVLSIGVDHPRFLEKLRQKLHLEYPVLYDNNSVVTKLYGVLNTTSPKGAPHPTVFVADRERVIRYKKVNMDHKYSLSVEEILDSLKNL